MPQASDELRAEWNGPADETAFRHLTQRGYVLSEDWEWHPPTAGWVVTEKDHSAMEYLIDEWDYGGYNAEPMPSSAPTRTPQPPESPEELKARVERLTAVLETAHEALVRMRNALRAIEIHHLALNARVNRSPAASTTLRLAREGIGVPDPTQEEPHA